jgi:protein SCO1/2
MYKMPAITLVRQDGTKVALAKAFDDGRPVVLNFIYTSCTAICPVTSQVFSDFREKLGDERKRVNMISVSIDPDYDTPQRLAEYASHYGADANWWFYTGSLQDSVAVQKAFTTYRGDKMNHAPVTLMRAAPGKPWVRVEGFASPDRLLAEYRKLTGKS